MERSKYQMCFTLTGDCTTSPLFLTQHCLETSSYVLCYCTVRASIVYYLVSLFRTTAPHYDVILLNFAWQHHCTLLYRHTNCTILRPRTIIHASSKVPGQSGPSDAYAPYLLKIATRLKTLGANTKLIFGITSPMLNSAKTDAVVQKLNTQAAAMMSSLNIPTVDMHKVSDDTNR